MIGAHILPDLRRSKKKASQSCFNLFSLFPILLVTVSQSVGFSRLTLHLSQPFVGALEEMLNGLLEEPVATEWSLGHDVMFLRFT